MISVVGGVLVLHFALFSEARIHKRFSERHGLSNLEGMKLIPNPSDTSAKLDQVEQSVENWSASRQGGTVVIAGVSSTGEVSPSGASTLSNSTSNPEASIGIVTDLQQALKDIQGQSNSGIAQLSGSSAMNSMAIELLKNNMTRFQQQVQSNFSRIDGLVNELGDMATTEGIQNLRSTIAQIQSQVSVAAAGASGQGTLQQSSQRISDLGTAVKGIDQRVTALENRVSGNAPHAAGAQSAEAVDSTLTTALSLAFLYQSWTGRVALLGAILGIAALALSIVTFTRLPKTSPEQTEGEEQVLMEAGDGEQQGENAGGEEYEEQTAIEGQA
jgi:hypothetical protein